MNKSKKSEANNQEKGQNKNLSKRREQFEELSLESLELVSGGRKLIDEAVKAQNA